MDNSFESQVLKELNIARTNPKEFCKKILEYERYFEDKVLKVPGHTPIQTFEGFQSFKEAAEFLSNTSNTSPLIANSYLTRIAEDALGVVTQSSDIDAILGLNIEPFIEKHGKVVGIFNETIDYGSETPELVVINMIVDDGDLSRPNRSAALNPKFKIVGVAVGSNKSYKNCTLVTYARHFFAKNEEIGDLSDDNYEEQEEKNSDFNTAYDCTKSAMSVNSGINQPASKRGENTNTNYDDFDLPKGVIKVDKQERVVIEDGVKKLITKYTKYLEDGTVQTELTKNAI